ncbi:hypothetical protein ACFL6I_23565, partial [candidate division KSB1 bacterium]
INNYFKLEYLKVSPLPEKVILGKKDWFFAGEPKLIEDYRCIYPLNEEQLKRIRQNLLARIKWFNEKGIKYYIIIPPNKNNIYPEFLPDYIRKVSTKSKLDQVLKYLENDTEIKIIDVRPVLKSAKKRQQIYFKSDTHWNQIGAYLGYYSLFNEICKDFPQLKPLELNELGQKCFQSKKGDIAKMLALNDVYVRNEIKLSTPNINPIKEFKTNRYPKRTKITSYDSGNGLKLVMFRDSFGSHLLPLIQYHFSRSVFIWTYELNTEIIEKEKPDIVIQQFLERFIAYSLLKENPPDIVFTSD